MGRFSRGAKAVGKELVKTSGHARAKTPPKPDGFTVGRIGKYNMHLSDKRQKTGFNFVHGEMTSHERMYGAGTLRKGGKDHKAVFRGESDEFTIRGGLRRQDTHVHRHHVGVHTAHANFRPSRDFKSYFKKGAFHQRIEHEPQMAVDRPYMKGREVHQNAKVYKHIEHKYNVGNMAVAGGATGAAIGGTSVGINYKSRYDDKRIHNAKSTKQLQHLSQHHLKHTGAGALTTFAGGMTAVYGGNPVTTGVGMGVLGAGAGYTSYHAKKAELAGHEIRSRRAKKTAKKRKAAK